MARFLICTMPITGHVNPGLPIARALIRRGHEVWWYTGRAFQARVEATGARYAPMAAALDFGDGIPQAGPASSPQRTGLAGLKRDIKHVFYDAVPGQVADLRRILQEFPADALVCDTAFIGAGALHELGGPPYAVFGITALTLGSRDTAPFGTALAPTSSPLGRLRNRALAALFQHGLFRDVNVYANGVRRALDLPPLRGSVLDSMSPFLYLHSSTPAFEYPRSDLPPQVHFIGPLLPPPPPAFAPPAWWPELHAGKPVVLVTQGTVATDDSDLIVPTLRALADEDVLVVATASSTIVHQLRSDQSPPRVHIGIVPHYGGVLLHANLITLVDEPAPPHTRGVLPANARLEPFIPFGQIMPHVDVMITNGGYGGVQFALAHGVPLVVAGTTEEKPEIAARVAWSDAGINLKAKSPTTEQIRAAVRSILANPRYRQNARRIGADYARHNAPEEAAVLLERLAATGQPVLRGAPLASSLPLHTETVITR